MRRNNLAAKRSGSAMGRTLPTRAPNALDAPMIPDFGDIFMNLMRRFIFMNLMRRFAGLDREGDGR